MTRRTKVVIAGFFLALIVLALLGWRSGCQAAKQEGQRADDGVVIGKQLETVASQTTAARQDQAEKQNEVDSINGADQRLPAGFGADLERVRRGQSKPSDPG